MNKRPISITLIALLFIAIGIGNLVRGILPVLSPRTWSQAAHSRTQTLGDAAWVGSTGILAALGGLGLLRGANWGRGLLAGWMAFHIILSILHSPTELIVHCVLFSLITYFLFRSSTRPFFQGSRV
jgi:uncharacterized protein YjeT (DUF2065 family)